MWISCGNDFFVNGCSPRRFPVFLVPTLRVGTRCMRRSASRLVSGQDGTRSVRTWVPTRSVGTRIRSSPGCGSVAALIFRLTARSGDGWEIEDNPSRRQAMIREQLRRNFASIHEALREPEAFALRWHLEGRPYSWSVFAALA